MSNIEHRISNIESKNPNLLPLGIVVVGLLLFVPFLGQVHLFDWDEINFAESAREMLVSGNYLRVQIDFKPFWEKPPLFFWLQALSMKVFGINEFAARFPNVLVGIATLLSFYYLGKKWVNATFGLLWGLVYIGAFTPHLYFKSGIIDPLFNLFIFWSVVLASPSSDRVGGESSNSQMRFLWAGVFAGLAVWTKGPVGVGIPVIVLGVLWILNRFKAIIRLRELLIFGFVSGLFTIGWVASIIMESGWDTFFAFLQYLYNLMATSEADHGEPFYYHFVVVLFGCFPMSVLALLSFRKKNNSQFITHNSTLKTLFWVVMIIFSLVKTKIVHYSSMAYFPLSFMAAEALYRWLMNHEKWPRWNLILLFLVATILSLVLTALPIVGIKPSLITPYLDDDFAVANLQSPVQWSGYEWLIGLAYWLCIVFAIMIWNKRKTLAVSTLLISTALCMMIYTAVVVPKIEGYSQQTMIDFYKSKKGQDVYVWPVGFKSYAQYFYFEKPANSHPQSSDENWLINGKVDKPVYLISRIDRAETYRQNRNLEVIKEENGFVFFRRK